MAQSGLTHPRRHRLRLQAVLTLLLMLCLWLPAAARADETVMVCDIYGNHVAPIPSPLRGIRTSERCPGNPAPLRYTRAHPPGGLAIWTGSGRAVARGASIRWGIRAPGGLVISAAYIPHMYSYGLNDGSGWIGGLVWRGGSRGVRTFNGQGGWSSANSGGPSFRWPSRGTAYFGWRLGCRARRCRGGDRWLSVELLEAHVRETIKPHLTAPDGLWQANGWIRGWWALHFSGDSPSGLCAMGASVNGKTGPGSVSARDPALWHQCSAPPVDQAVDTAQYGQGVLPLAITAIDAAGRSVSYTRTIEVDNQRPTLGLSGPTDASSTAGTQYVHAAGTAGPSGVAGILCSLDRAPSQWYVGPSASIPVQGVGVHHLTCYSQSNARDSSGVRASSAPAAWTLRIRAPSVSTLSFVRIASALRCTHRRERVRIPAHWATAYRHGHRVRVRVPAQTRRVRVVHCHPRVVQRRVRRHGHWITRRVVVLPHQVAVERLRIPFGTYAELRGWLGARSGDAIRGQRVRIIAVPANGSENFRQVATARTGSNGVWQARLRPGPSRIVMAIYDGSSKFEPSKSMQARVVVPARIRLRIEPHRAHWGGTIRISGQVLGGYIPPGGEIVFLSVRWRGGSAEVGDVYTGANGLFSRTYTFHRGTGAVNYSFWATTGRETDYPYAPGHSNRVAITVSP